VPWRGCFDDPEDGFAAHRFSWIIQVLASHGDAAIPLARGMFADWVAQRGYPGDGPGWDSYSVAERMAAAVYLVAADESLAGAIHPPLRAHGDHLMRHLEFRGASTNNHILNDARALYLAGRALGDASMAHQAREIFDFAVPRMFVEGFLREGSTHYHLLLLRTLIEVALAARRDGDRAFAERAAAWARGAAAAATLFAADGVEMPLIGDLSPDFTPDFLARLAPAAGPLLDGSAHDDTAADWAALFGAGAAPAAVPADEAASRSAAGYHRIAAGGFRVWAWVNPDGHVPAWSHAHADIGSFVASWHGKPLLIDTGRVTYKAGAMSAFGRSVRSHNGISIDGAEPCIVHGLNAYPELLRADYRDARPRASAVQTPDGWRIDIAHDGFARLGSGMIAARAVDLSKNALTITDRISGSGRHTVESFFHFPPEAQVQQVERQRWRVEIPGAPGLLFQAEEGVSAARAVEGDRPMGWTSRRYGQAEASTSLIVRREVTLPFTSACSIVPA
jgi:hypothetical protein